MNNAKIRKAHLAVDGIRKMFLKCIDSNVRFQAWIGIERQVEKLVSNHCQEFVTGEVLDVSIQQTKGGGEE